MQGNLQQRGPSSWRIRVFLGRDDTGKKRYLERTVRGTKREAQRVMAHLVVEVDEGRHVAAAATSFGAVLERWLEVKSATIEATTLASYRWIATTYLMPRMANTPLDKIRAFDLDTMYARLRAAGGTDGAPLSPRTVRYCQVPRMASRSTIGSRPFMPASGGVQAGVEHVLETASRLDAIDIRIRLYYTYLVAELLDLDLLGDDDPFEIDDQAAHLFKHPFLGIDDIHDVWQSDPLFYPAKPPAHWLMVAEVSGRVLVVPLAPPETGDPTKCRPIGCYDAADHLADRYREDR